ncbi:MAG: hypothetical protein P9L92_19145 [Candidatus Electryonea clarkiae]|nr:hypothetical protein [Candidatus Electryonea clarkiae]MDP8287377.1 hypothetical protein [Candidatus Electryonea clarkiae]
MKFALDAAGEEPGLESIVQGVLSAQEKAAVAGMPFHGVLYGLDDDIRDAIRTYGGDFKSFDIVNAPEIIHMNDQPRDVLINKPASSIIKAVKDLKVGFVDAFISMGNTGAIVGASRALLGKIKWINKPALGIPIPQKNSTGFLLDVGATSDPKAAHIPQFAAMGSVFAELVHKIKDPKVGLLNMGSESNKGDAFSKEVHKLLHRTPLRFVGNIEGGDIFTDKADVIVTSGFVGNVLLKLTESLPGILMQRIKEKDLLDRISGFLSDFDYTRYGGAALLGVEGTVVIGHGKSNSEAVSRAILRASEILDANLINNMREKVYHTRRALWLSNPFSRGEGSEDEI